jgi:hypothetical protein
MRRRLPRQLRRALRQAGHRDPRRPCLRCGRPFRPTPVLSGMTTEHYCGTECAYAALLARERGNPS